MKKLEGEDHSHVMNGEELIKKMTRSEERKQGRFDYVVSLVKKIH